MPNACLIVIGNEILSGRTQDKNIAWLARELNEIGVRVMEVRVIPDITQTIIDTVNTVRAQFTYVFTTGGIGPTHDDITADAMARAFGARLERSAEAVQILQRHYGEGKTLNAARLKMAEIPAGASLIYNPVSAAPGFIMGNVYVMAGVPSIMQAMFAGLKHTIKGGAKMLSRTISAFVTEGNIAEALSAIQDQNPGVEIGSYPFFKERLGTSLVARATDAAKLSQAYAQIKTMLLSHTQEITEEDLAV